MDITSAYSEALQLATKPDTPTDQRDERHDLPAATEADIKAGRQWLNKMNFLCSPEHDSTWRNIKKNWISFLSATSEMPNSVLAPDRKAVRWLSDGRDYSATDAETKKRFRQDRWRRMIVQSSFWNNLDSAEAMVERWPAKARVVLNTMDKEPKEDFDTFAAIWDLGWRRRCQAVLSSLVSFMLHCNDEGTLQEMGLELNEDQFDDILDIEQAVWLVDRQDIRTKAPFVLHGVWAAVHGLVQTALEKKRSTPRNNPLLWWMAILVRSATSGENDFISSGRFNKNPIPMDLDIRGRVAGLLHYCKVLVLDSSFASWDSSTQWLHEVEDDLNSVDLEWINGESGGRPDPTEDWRDCSSPAWQSVVAHIQKQIRAKLGGDKGTAMQKIRLLESSLGEEPSGKRKR